MNHNGLFLLLTIFNLNRLFDISGFILLVWLWRLDFILDQERAILILSEVPMLV